jgi:hypothetical protein
MSLQNLSQHPTSSLMAAKTQKAAKIQKAVKTPMTLGQEKTLVHQLWTVSPENLRELATVQIDLATTQILLVKMLVYLMTARAICLKGPANGAAWTAPRMPQPCSKTVSRNLMPKEIQD